MAKRRQPKREAVKNRCSLFAVEGTLTVNGKVHKITSVDYSRTEYADGRVEEHGVPDGLPPNPSIGELLAHAFDLEPGKDRK